MASQVSKVAKNTALLFLLALLPRGTTTTSTTPRVHAFYYLWYGNPAIDGHYLHWNHEILPHWNPTIAVQWPSKSRFAAPAETHSPFSPSRGCYSSSDPALLDAHMNEMKRAGIGAAIFSWWGRPEVEGTSDTQGVATDAAVHLAVAAAERAGLAFAFHMEPYPGRSVATFRADVAYLHARFGASPSWLRSADGRPWYYVYDSYHIAPAEWATALTVGSNPTSISLRGGDADGYFVALWLDRNGGELAHRGGFDATYSYFASDGFSFGSTTRNWGAMAAYSREVGMAFVASVGPGYNDERIRPWNSANTKARRGGAYYEAMWSEAISAGAAYVSITSWNEWGEGTQIEPAAVGKVIVPPELTLPSREEARAALPARTYLDYGAGGAELYLRLTRKFARQLSAEKEEEEEEEEL